jgi:hypothetical protein
VRFWRYLEKCGFKAIRASDELSIRLSKKDDILFFLKIILQHNSFPEEYADLFKKIVEETEALSAVALEVK